MPNNGTIDRLTISSPPESVSQYHAFVDSSPQGMLYCKTWWLEATAPGRWEVLVLRIGDDIKAAWPLVYNARGNIGMPPLTQKLGVIFAPSTARYAKQLGDEIAVCDQFLDHISPEIGVNQQFHEAFYNWLAFMWRGFSQTTKYTYIFDDLENVADYMSRMTNDCRQRINKSVKELSVCETDDLQLMYDINSLTFERQGVKCPYSLELVQRVHDACRSQAGARIIIAKDGAGNIHACDYMVYDRRCAVSIIQGADPRFRKGGAQRLLDWDSINFAATVSAKFDFEGSVMPGVEPYNRGFGARQTPYFVLRRPRRWKSRLAARQRRLVARALHYIAERVEPTA
ncbi:MAG: GNAT family N-acetyltransferase [Pirellulales bacterium]